MTDVEEVDDFLEHFGVKGMRWGVRQGRGKTGVSRTQGALIDRNLRTKKKIKDASSGKKHHISVAIGKALIGEDAQKRNWATATKNLNAQNSRVRRGKATLGDRLQAGLQVSIAELVVSAKPLKS